MENSVVVLFGVHVSLETRTNSKLGEFLCTLCSGLSRKIFYIHRRLLQENKLLVIEVKDVQRMRLHVVNPGNGPIVSSTLVHV